MSDLRDMSEATRIRVARSELVIPTVIYQSAVEIFSAFIAAGKVTEDNEKSAMQKAINMAVEVAIETDRMLDSDSGGRHHFNR